MRGHCFPFVYSFILLGITVCLNDSAGADCDAAFQGGGCETCCQRGKQQSCETCCGIDRDPGFPAKPKRKQPGDVDRGDCPPYRYQMNDCQRAGNPKAIHRWAKCSVDGKYSAWFIGGDAAFANVPQLPIPLLSRGRERKSNAYHDFGEGTWGLDYGGLFGKSNVWLNYTRGRNQGGEGTYETDGEPKFVKQVKLVKEHIKESIKGKH